MTIKSADISVIVQGAIDWDIDDRMGDARTRAATRMLRKLLPEAEIIVSTWTRDHVDGLTYDVLVRSADPGGQGALTSYTPNNVNRQITSTIAGLRRASRPYCIKIRADMILMGTDFLGLWESAAPLGASPAIFTRPILANNLTSRRSASILDRLPDHPLLFHPSDHFHFGICTDLLTLWDVPLQSDEDAFFFVDRTQPNGWRYHELSRFTPEQFVLIGALSKTMTVDMRHYADINPVLYELSRHVMNSQFLFIPDLLVPVHFEKYHTPHHFSFEWMRHNPMTFPEIIPPSSPVVGPDGQRKRSLARRVLSDLAFPFLDPKGFCRWFKRVAAEHWQALRR